MRWIGIAALFLAAASFGTASGVLFAYMGDLPQISALDDQAPVTGTRVLGKDDSVVAEFATEHRQPVTYDQIPQVLQQAIVATEDAGFWHNSGVDLKRIAVIVIRRALFQRTGGASTITQQLARSVFPKTIGYERSGLAGIERKAKEWLFAIQIDKRYTKQEILTMYCNKMYFGGGAYGVEAASQLYFAKSVTALSLDEAALIAGLFQGNESQNPYKHMPEALARRNTVLGRMAAEGYITPEAAAAAKKRPIVTRGQPTASRSVIAPYFAEYIRIQLEERYGAKAVYEGGLTVKTGLDPVLQQTANRALDSQLRAMDKSYRGVYRKPARNLLAEGKTIEGYRNPRWHDPIEGEVLPAVVTSVAAGVISATAGKWDATIGPDGYRWTGRRAETLVRRGDLIEVQVGKLAPKTNSFAAKLDQPSEFEGAVLAIDNHTGQVLAMVGGKDFQRSQFNRSTQAMRQVGSLFKAFVYTTAIDRGYTASSYLADVPSSFVAGPNQPLYEPKNFDNKFEGEKTTVRRALEDSRNVPTIRLMDMLGPPTVIETARKFGVTGPLPPYLPIAIGAGDDTLWEMTSAYTTFPNQGVRMTPLPILEVTDREGNVLESHRPDPHEVIKADTAFIMTSLFQGVIERGTAAWAATQIHDWPIAGKTGTTDDATDAWFIGFDPDITIGVWVGYDQKKTMGKEVQGAAVALPVWVNIMKPWIERRRAELGDPPVFGQPGNIVFQMTPEGILEAYIAGTEPGGRHD
jgi:penicillin-binding protein 1A